MLDNSIDFIYDLSNLEGKIAIITGGSQGIGEDLSKTLAMAGANNALYNRNKGKGKHTASWVSQKGRDGRYFQCDVSVKSQVENMVNAVKMEMGPVDILVNCAGINRIKNAVDFTEKEFLDILYTNLAGVFWCCQA